MTEQIGHLAADVPRYRHPADEPPPRGVKLMVLTSGGVALLTDWNDDTNFVAWSPLLRIGQELKARLQAEGKLPGPGLIPGTSTPAPAAVESYTADLLESVESAPVSGWFKAAGAYTAGYAVGINYGAHVNPYNRDGAVPQFNAWHAGYMDALRDWKKRKAL